MKKQLTGVLALVAGLACLAGCTDNNSNKTPQYDLDAAKGALQGLVGTTGEGRVDYELPNSISVGDYTYSVSWTTNATEGVVLDAGEETTYVDVDRSLTANLTYNLVGTITAPDGTTIEAPIKRTLLKAPTTVPGDAITAAPVAGTPYVYHVYQSTLDKDLYFTGEMSGYYFKTTESAEEAVSVYVEYVENSTELFNLYFLDSIGDKQYIGVKQNDTHNNIVFGEEVVSSFTYDATVGSIITTIDLVDGETTTPTSFYLGNYSSYYTIQASKTSYAGSAGNNVGHLVTLIDKTTVADADKVADAKKALDIETSYFGNNVVRLPDQGDRYPEVSITWTAEENANVSVSGKKLITTNPSAVQTVKLTATITCGESTDTKEFTVSVKPQLNTPAEVVDAAYALAAGEVLGEYTLTGVITSVDLAYDSNYKNVTVTIAVAGKEDKPIVAFRLKGENADVIKAGDTITVTGTLKNYNGTVEFDAGCTLDAYVAGDTPVVPDDSTSSDNGSESTGGEESDALLAENTAYKIYIKQVKLDKTLYIDGGVNGRYLTMTENATEGVDVYAEKVDGGYKFYILVDSAKQYVNIYMNSDNKVSVNYTADSTCVYNYNAESNCWYTIVNDTEYYLGTYNTFNTVSASKTSFINASNTGVEQFPVEFITKADAEASAPVEPDDSTSSGSDSTGGENDELLKENTAYKFYVAQNNIGANYYLTGTMSGNFLATTLNPTEAVDVYVEKADGGYSFYFTVESTKTYINIVSGKAALATENPTVYVYNDETKIWYTNVDGTDYYLGTYNTYTTISASKTSYITASNTGVSQFPATFVLASEAKAPTDAEKVALEKNKLSLKSEVEGVAEITLSTTGSVYTDVLISWTLVANENASIVDNVLNITNPSADTTVTVTATVKSGDVTETKEFVINVKAVSASEIKYYADLETLTANSSYTTSTTTNGWTATNCAVQTGGAEGTNSGSAFNAFFGTDTNAKGVCLNGKTSAVGSLTSPTLKGGVKSISFNYGFGFSENNGVSLTVTVYSTDGSELAKTTCVNTSVTKLETYEFTWDLTSNNITVDCYIVITNNSPSNNSGNKDRTTIWNVAWVPASTEENA